MISILTLRPYQVNNIQVESTSIVIPFNPYLDNITPVCTIPELNTPYGVAVTNDGHVIVSELSGNCVSVLDREGKKVKSFGKGNRNIKFSIPSGVVVTPDNFIFVADNHKIQKISMDGEYITSVGKEGSGPLEFDHPYGIAISSTTGHIYIVDCSNHRIQVLNPDLTFSHKCGIKGSAEGQVNRPRGVAIDQHGLVYVTDTDNDRIQKFTPEGQFLSQFGIKGSGPEYLKHPSGIVTDDNLMYITDWGNHRISIFTTDGQFVRSFGEIGSNDDQFCNPHGITIDSEGYLYVCDYSNKRLLIY